MFFPQADETSTIKQKRVTELHAVHNEAKIDASPRRAKEDRL